MLTKWISEGYPYKAIKEQFNISDETIRRFKNKISKINNEEFTNTFKKPKIHKFTSLTKQQINSIVTYNEKNPFHNPVRIKRELRLKCDRKTVANVLSKLGIRSYCAVNEPLINERQYQLKKDY